MTKFVCKQVEVREYHGKSFGVVERELPDIKEGEVVIKIANAPLIHFDIMKMSGATGAVLPYVPCIEVSGVIEHSLNQDLIGKKVSYMSLFEGCLKSRIIAPLSKVLILDDKVELVQACILSCNPFTAIGIVDTAISLGAKGLAITTGNSNVGILVNRIATEKGLKCISIVRSDEKVKELKENGHKHVINSSDEDFVKNLNALMIELEASVIFDALSGPIVGKLVKALPKFGHYINFGTQTGQKMSEIDATDLRWGFKEIKYYLVSNWIDKKIKEGTFDSFKQYVNDNVDLFLTPSGKVFDVDKFTEAIEYAEHKSDLLKVVIDLNSL